MFEQKERVADLATLARRDPVVLHGPRVAVIDSSEPFGAQLHEPHDSRAARALGQPALALRSRLRQGRSCLSAKPTLAGRSASRRMYHAYQNSPYAIRLEQGYPSSRSRASSSL